MNVHNLKLRIKEIQETIKEVQDQCSHPEACVTKTHGSNTGNFDPHQDSYWTDFECSLCEKRWQEDGSK